MLSDWGPFFAEVTLIAGVIHFYINHPRSFSRNGRVFIFGLMFIHLMLISLVFSFVEGDIFGEGGERYGFLLCPLAFAPFSVSILLGRAQALL